MALKFTFKVNEDEFSEEDIEKVLPAKAMQLVFYNIKEKLENYVTDKSVEKAIDRIVVLCENGNIKEATLIVKE